MLRGICLARLGRWSDAIPPLERGVSTMPDDVRGLSNLAAAYMGGGEPAKARDSAERVLTLDPNDPVAQQVMARLQEPERIHLVSFLEGYDATWSRLGWVLVGVGIVATVLLIIHPPLTGATPGAKDPMKSIMPKTDGASIAQLGLWLALSLLSLLYSLVDILDRRARFAWLIPQMMCGLCGIPWMPMLVYFWIGRTPPRKVE